MKKNLFLLFSTYFFVIQPLIIGVLRWDTRFFRLAAINLLAIILIALLYSTIEWSEKEEVHHHERKPEPINEPKVSFQEHFRTVVKERKKRSELPFPSIISLLVGTLFFLMFPTTTPISEAMIALFAVVIGFVIFIILTLIFKHRITKWFWRLIGTRLYILLLIWAIGLTAFDYYQAYNDYQVTIRDYLAQNLLGEEMMPSDGYVFTGQGTVLGSGLGATTGTEETVTDVFSGMTWTASIEKTTGTVLGTSTDSITTGQKNTTPSTTTIGYQKMMDAVIYLMHHYNIPLVTSKNIAFTYVSTKNPYYTERRTAYANKLIGSSTNPSKYITCDTYIVMKWLLEKWPVTYTSTTVRARFRAEAVTRNALNGCEKGKIVTDKTL